MDTNVKYRNIQVFRFSGEFGVFYELGKYDLLYILWDHNINMTHLMGPVCVGYSSGSPGNQIPPYRGQDDLFRALEVELGHINPIRNFLLMQWNLEVQPTSNYSLEMALQVFIRFRSC